MTGIGWLVADTYVDNVDQDTVGIDFEDDNQDTETETDMYNTTDNDNTEDGTDLTDTDQEDINNGDDIDLDTNETEDMDKDFTEDTALIGSIDFAFTLVESISNMDSIESTGDSVHSTSSQVDDTSTDNTQSGEGSLDEFDDELKSCEGSNDADSNEDACVGLLQTACGRAESEDGFKSSETNTLVQSIDDERGRDTMRITLTEDGFKPTEPNILVQSIDDERGRGIMCITLAEDGFKPTEPNILVQSIDDERGRGIMCITLAEDGFKPT
eukprot:777986_1